MLTLFVQGMKGLQVLRNFPQKIHPLIKEVKIGRDKKIVNDYSNEIRSFCKKNSIVFSISNVSNSFDSEYAIAIGWHRCSCFDSQSRRVIEIDLPATSVDLPTAQSRAVTSSSRRPGQSNGR